MKENPTVYQPVGDNVQLDYDPTPTNKVGAIYLPQNAKGAQTIMCDIIAVGPLCQQVKPGQRAVIAINQIILLKLNGDEVSFTKEDRILAVCDRTAVDRPLEIVQAPPEVGPVHPEG